MIIKRYKGDIGNDYYYECYFTNNIFEPEPSAIWMSLINDKNKCILYSKSDNHLIRLFSLFMLKKKISNYDIIKIDFGGISAFNSSTCEWERFE
jgi:hypothetical protein